MINNYYASGITKSFPQSLVCASARRTSTWSHTSTGNHVAVPWDADGYDPHGFHSTSSNTERLTVPVGLGGGSGVFIAGTGLFWNTSATGSRITRILHYNSSSVLQRFYETNMYYGVTGDKGQICSGMFWNVADGDYFIAHGYQDSGGNLNGVDDITAASIWCIKVV